MLLEILLFEIPKKETLLFFWSFLNQEATAEIADGSHLGNILKMKPMLRIQNRDLQKLHI